MKALKKILKDLQSRGFEEISIIQVLNFIYQIEREARAKRIEDKLSK